VDWIGILFGKKEIEEQIMMNSAFVITHVLNYYYCFD